MEERLGKALWMKYEWCGGSARNARRAERRVPILHDGCTTGALAYQKLSLPVKSCRFGAECLLGSG